MDNTALNPQQNQQVEPVVPQATGAQQAVPQQPANPALPTMTQGGQVAQPSVTAGRPEAPVPTSGLPLREAAPIAEAEATSTATDDSASQPDAVSEAAGAQQKEAGDVQLQESHPQVAELQGFVEKGPDAEREQLPEEQLANPDQVKQPDTQASASGISLATPPLQMEEVKKKHGVRDAIKWLAVSLIRQLKRMNMKPEDQKTTW